MGVCVIQAMARREPPESIEPLNGGTSGVDLIEHLARRPKVIDLVLKEAKKIGQAASARHPEQPRRGGATMKSISLAVYDLNLRST